MKKSTGRKITKRKKVRKPSSSWRWLVEKGYTRWRWIGGVLTGVLYIYLFYTFLVAPFSLRWRGVFGDIDYPEGYSIRGIDISHHQGRVNWDKMRWAKIGDEPLSFIFMKATEGQSLVDRQFECNFSQAKDFGFIRGAYHFFVPGISPELQARHFMNIVKLEAGDLPPVLDIETRGNLSPEELRRDALAWLHFVEKHYQIVPILYTNYGFKKEYLNTPDFDKYPYWIAHYYVKELKYHGEWRFWQHTDKGHLSGIRGDVDLNIFNGSMYNLKMLTIPGDSLSDEK